MTSFIAAGGSGRSTSVIPAVPAASSVTTIAFIGAPPGVDFSPVTDCIVAYAALSAKLLLAGWIRQLNPLERCPCRSRSSTEQKDRAPHAPRDQHDPRPKPSDPVGARRARSDLPGA